MKKKDYLKPTMKVVKLQQHGFIMASPDGHKVQATMNDTWEEENI